MRPSSLALCTVLALACAGDSTSIDSAQSALTLLTEVAPTRDAGTIGGALTVGNDGHAHYAVPLRVVPGRNQMQPSLALHYQSVDDVGELGRGWHLEGAPSITRCGRTVATDGARRSVLFDDGDAYCLQGQRLIEISSTPTYADFRTEVESFQLIRMFKASHGPEHWRVRGPDGMVTWFGMPAERAAVPLSDEPLIAEWKIARVEDPFGNAMRYVWSQPIWPSQPGTRGEIAEVVLESIEYASHVSPPAAPC